LITQRSTKFTAGQPPTNEIKTLTSPYARADLRARRKALRLTLLQLGQEAGMRKAQVSRVERGCGPDGSDRRTRPATVARLVAALDRLEAPAMSLVQQFAALAELPGHPAFPLASGMVEEAILDRIDTAMGGGIMSEHETPAGPTLVVRGGLMALMRIVAPHHYESRLPPCLKTDTRPGTPERLAVYAQRFRKGETLFNDRDAGLEPSEA
jgi:hypothetical protein